MVDVRFAWLGEMPSGQLPVYVGGIYQRLFAEYDGCEARVLACHAVGRTFHLPLLLRDLGGGVKEAYSAYGYGGFIGPGQLSAEEFGALKAFLAGESVLCIFLRHSPFLANQRLLPAGLTELNRHTYAAPLATHADFDACLAGMPQKIRWAANYARRAGLQVKFTSLAEGAGGNVNAFHALYAALMRKKDTSKYYLFSETFFREHARLGAQCELAEIVDSASGRLLAGAFFLLDDSGWVHYHLSAAEPEAMKLQGMELLMASAIFRYGSRGCKALHLGGGHVLDESDGLSRFKSKFGSERYEFHCSRLICDESAYHAERARTSLAHPNFFLIADARG